MSNQPTQSFFFPDPFGTGEGIYIQAVNLEDAHKQLDERRPKDQKTAAPTQPVIEQLTPAEEAVEPAKENS